MAVPLTLSSVPAQTPYVQYVSGASQTVFPYPFEITQDSDLVVLLNGNALPTNAGYTLSGQGTTVGGNVTFTVGQAAGTLVTLYRYITIARITQLAQNGTFFSSNFNDEFNRIYLIMQQLAGGQSGQGLFLQVPITNNPTPTTLLTPSTYAGKYLAFDANGNPVPAPPVSVLIPASGAVLIAQTLIEAANSIVPANYLVAPGNPLRYGADPTGVADSTAAFSSAAQSTSTQANPQFGIGGTGITFAPNATVFVPPGTYLLNSEVNTGGNQVTYILADGAVITNVSRLNGSVSRPGERANNTTYGIGQTAVAFSAVTNYSLEAPPAIMGFTAASQIGSYGTRDSVAMYVQNNSPALLATIANSGTTYTGTTIAFSAALSATQLLQMRTGMIVDTGHSPLYWSGFVTSWTANSITVSNWYKSDNSGASTPTNGTGGYVNPATKIWAHNANVIIGASAHTTAAAGFELGLQNNKSNPGGSGGAPLMWGFDCVNLGTYPCEVAHIARGGAAGFYYGFESNGNGTGFYSNQDSVGVTVSNSTGTIGFQTTGAWNAATTVYSYINSVAYGNAVTANGVGFINESTLAAGTALTNVIGYQYSDVTLGGGASATNQYGFRVQPLVGATNNVAFLSQVAAGAGNYAFLSTGTAASQFGGGLGLYGNTAPAQQTGIGTPTGVGVVANFPGATATLTQCSQTIAGILATLKSLGLYGA